MMSAMASQITSLAIVYSTVYSRCRSKKHQSSASLAFFREIHRWPVNSPHKGPVTRKMSSHYLNQWWLDYWRIYASLGLSELTWPISLTADGLWSLLLSQRPVTRSFDVFFDLRLNKRLSKQSWGWWFETPSRALWRHCNARCEGFSSNALALFIRNIPVSAAAGLSGSSYPMPLHLNNDNLPPSPASQWWQMGQSMLRRKNTTATTSLKNMFV